MGRFLIVTAASVALWAGDVSASEPVTGLWSSPPDHKGQTGVVEVKPCGPAYCGKLIKAFDPNGKQIVTPNVGRQLIWGMKPLGAGKYGDGRAFVPVFGADFPAKMELQGNTLTISGCKVGLCKSQVWTRVP